MIPQEPDLEAAALDKPPPKLDPREFRSHLGCFATGVTIITALGGRGQMLGVTANSFNSVSLDPPLVLFSLDRRAYSLWDFLSTGHFAVNILAEDQHELSNRFARTMSDKWSGVEWQTWDHGCPILAHCHANFECSIAYTYAGGDHVIFVGRVERMAYDDARRPLLYYRGAYHRLHEPRSE
jgi:flavin reductase (DIM6/NTAB) family NADH-FMN oxidoreductase RutF